MADDTPPARQSGADGPTDIPARSWKEIALATWKEAGEDNLELVAAGVAFYAFLAFVPLLAAFVLSYGLVADPASVVGHMSTLTNVMPESAAEIIGEQMMNMTETAGATTGFALLLAIGIALYGAMRGATAIMTALNIVYDAEESRGIVQRYAMAIAMTLGAVISLLLAVLAISALNFVEALLPDLGGVVHLLLQVGFVILAAAAVIALLAMIYRYGPNRPNAKWRWITPGSVIATVVWLAATLGFGFYVSNFGNYNATYGSLGAVVVFLTWLYLTAYIILLGGELNSELEEKVGEEEVLEGGAAQAGPRPKQRLGGTAPADDAAPRPRRALANDQEQDRSSGMGAVVAKIGLFALVGKLLGSGRDQRSRLA
ncbi:MAG: YihY/virulence factor BrkB family protein [Allosphingosinicella sp.]|uniref:YihY/virulence factor BrkB family protein n=1 Tax=Allosphingosinicella sp. TaxID=2823234 RepID=UPI00393960A0